MMFCELAKRGNDASGICIVNGGDIFVHKEDVPAPNFVRTDEYKKFMLEHLRPETDIVLVHTRYATKGTPRDNENNHPVYAGKSAVVHNGVIHNEDMLFRELKLERKAEVDTDVVRAVVDKLGMTHEAVKELSRLGGSAACAVVSTDHPGHLLLMRSGNPMVIGCTRSVLGFASTKETLHKCFRPYFQKWGLYFRQNATDTGFGGVQDETALLLDPTGKMLWHQEFKLGSSYVPPDYSRVHKEYRGRNQRHDKVARENRQKAGGDSQPDVVYCPNVECRMACVIEERLKDKPLWKLACEACFTRFAPEPRG